MAKADKLANKVRAILEDEVEPVGSWTQVVIDDRRFRSLGDGLPQQSSTTVFTDA